MPHFLGYEVDFPYGPAAGAINGPNLDTLIQHSRQIIRSPAGALMIGSICLNPSNGNDHYGRTYYHDPVTGETVNSMGLPNIGMETAENSAIPYLAKLADANGMPLIVSVSAAAGEDPNRILPELAERALLAGATAIETNYSCPNKFYGGSSEPVMGYDANMVADTHDSIARKIGDAPWIEKLPPYIDEKAFILRSVIEALSGVRYANFVATANAIGGVQLTDESGRAALDTPGNVGGLSGPATANIGLQQLQVLRRKLPIEVGIISTLGVMTGQDVLERFDNGADFAMAVTRYFEGGDYGRTTAIVLDEFDQALESRVNTD